MVLLAFLLFSIIHSISCSNILFIPKRESPSHIWSLMPLALRLNNAGHKITFLDLNGGIKESITYPENIKCIHVNHTKIEKPSSNFFAKKWKDQWRGYDLWTSFIYVEDSFQLSYEQQHAKYIAALEGSWDLIVVDMMDNNHGYYISKALYDKGIPYVITHTSVMFNSLAASISLGANPTARTAMFPSLPHHDYKPYDPTNIFERIDQIWDEALETINFLIRCIFSSSHFKLNIYLTISVPSHLNLYKKLIGKPFSFEEHNHDSAYILTDNIDEFGFPSPGSSSIISMGAHCLQRTNNEIDDDLLKFINQDSRKLIYVAFGSIVDWRTAPDEKKEALFNALNELDEFKIVFVYSADDFNFQSHVKTVKWVNQGALLKHKLTATFVSHGGLKSFRESLCAKVPMVILPIFAEQAYNCRMGVERKFAVPLNKNELTVERIKSRIKEVAYNPSFKAQVEHDYSLYLDQPMDELERALFYVERAIRLTSKSSPQYKIKGVQISWITHFYLDLIVFVLCLCCISL